MPLDSYVTLGRSGLRVSPFTLGTMTFGEDNGWGASPAHSATMLAEYLDRGGNSIDTANIYTLGHAEKIVGDYFAARPGLRDRVVIGTKFFGNLWPGDPNGGSAGRKAIVAQAEDSLRRLQTDYIDVYWLHNFDPAVPLEETLRALDDLVSAGKVRYVGVSDLPAWRVAEAQVTAHFRGWSPVIGVQLEYSLLERTVEGELLPMARAHGIGVLPWGPLRGGLLSGKWSRRQEGDVDSRRARVRPEHVDSRRAWVRPADGDYAVLDALDKVADETGHSAAAVALSWVQHRPGVVSTLIGARRPDQLRTNLDAIDVELSAEQTASLDAASAPRLPFPADNNRLLAPNLAFAGATVDGVPTDVPVPLRGEIVRY